MQYRIYARLAAPTIDNMPPMCWQRPECAPTVVVLPRATYGKHGCEDETYAHASGYETPISQRLSSCSDFLDAPPPSCPTLSVLRWPLHYPPPATAAPAFHSERHPALARCLRAHCARRRSYIGLDRGGGEWLRLGGPCRIYGQ